MLYYFHSLTEKMSGRNHELFAHYFKEDWAFRDSI